MVSVGLASSGMATCWEPEEYEAARQRDLQTVLMVSALKCGRAQPDVALAYNAWVGRAKTALLAGEQKLLAHFAREGDQAKYDKFTTALANKYSELADYPAFCKRAKTLMALDEAQPGILTEVVMLLNARPNGVDSLCPARPRQSTIIVSPFDPVPVAGTGAPVAAPVADATPAPAPAPEAAIPDGTGAPQRR